MCVMEQNSAPSTPRSWALSKANTGWRSTEKGRKETLEHEQVTKRTQTHSQTHPPDCTIERSLDYRHLTLLLNHVRTLRQLLLLRETWYCRWRFWCVPKCKCAQNRLLSQLLRHWDWKGNKSEFSVEKASLRVSFHLKAHVLIDSLLSWYRSSCCSPVCRSHKAREPSTLVLARTPPCFEWEKRGIKWFFCVLVGRIDDYQGKRHLKYV